MWLIEASIRGFGKLVDRRFHFARGAQIVVGDNEAGKSTLQKFILAMLFGLKREDRKRREYLPQYDLNRPWSGAPYAGRLVYELSDGSCYEVLRDFERKNESLQILDAVSGRDLTDEYLLDARKERTFMQKQLQLTRQLFESTTSLGQLAGRPSAAGVGAFRERVQGLLDSGDEGVSARAALACLAEMRDRCGNERTPTRGIGLLMKQRKILQAELEAARARHDEILALHARLAGLSQAHELAESAWRRRRAADVGRERAELSRRVRRVESLGENLETLRHRLDSFADVQNVDASEYAPAREHAAAIAALDAESGERAALLERLRARATTLRELVRSLTAALGKLDPASAAQMYHDAERLREHIGQLRAARVRHADEQRRNRRVVEALRRHHGRDWTHDDFMATLASQRVLLDDAEFEPLQREAKHAARTYGVLKHRMLAGFVLSAVLIGAATVLGWWNPWFWSVVVRFALPIACGLIAFALLAHTLRDLVDARDRAQSFRAQAARLGQRQREAQLWLQEVMDKNDVRSLDDLYRARREYEMLRAEAERSAGESSGRRVRDTESGLADLAARLHMQVERCDFESLQRLRNDPPDAARSLLPYAEESGVEEDEQEDAPELQRLVAALGRIPDVRRAFDWLERVREELQRVEGRLATEEATHSERCARRDGESAALAAILHRNGARDVDDFAQRVERQRQRQAMLSEYLPLRREQEGVLGGESVEALRARVTALATAEPEAAHDDPTADPDAETARGGSIAAEEGWLDGSDAELGRAFAASEAGRTGAVVDSGVENGSSLEELRRRVEQLAAERAQLEERLAAREGEGRRPAEVELELEENERRLEDERRQDESLRLAIETLEALAVARHREVAPRMNARVGEIFARLSRGQHTEVRLDEELTPRIRMDGDAVHGADSLSGGAADQLYFALRVTAGEQLARSGERLPLLLDDPFVQYDPERLRAALELVTELAQEHQILFFTCEVSQARALATRLQAHGVEHDTVVL